MSINQRIKDFAIHKKISIRKFEQMCSLSNGYVSNINYAIGEDKMLNIIQTFPDINPVWLQMGEGNMLKSNYNADANFEEAIIKVPEINPHFEQRSIEALSRALDRLTQMYEKVVLENDDLKVENENLKRVVSVQKAGA